MVQDEAIKYNSLFQEVELAIVNIENLGFDMNIFREQLKEIHNSVNENVKVNYTSSMLEASYIQSYSNGIYNLNKLKNQLDRYDIYLKVKNICEFINMKSFNDMSLEQLEKCVSKLIYALREIHKSGTIDYDNEKHIVESLYETVYNVMKLEIIMNGESQLYLYIKSDDINKSYFNKLIMGDIEKINLNNDSKKNLKTKILELGQDGIYTDYLDLELIKLIIINIDNTDLKKVIYDKLEKLCDDIIISSKSILKKEENYKYYKSKNDSLINEYNKVKKKFNKKLTSFVLSISLMITGLIGSPIFARRAAKKLVYDRYLYSYYSSSESYASDRVDEGYFGFFGEDDDIYYSNLTKFDNDGKELGNIDLSFLNFNSIEEYVSYISNNKKIDGVYEIKDDESYVIEFEHRKRNLNSKAYVETVILTFLMYCFILLIYIYCDLLDKKTYYKMKHYLVEVKKYKEELDNNNNNVINWFNQLMNEINKNEELRNRFNELFNANLFLLDNPDELYKRIDKICNLEKIENVKKLIRDSKKSR